MTIRISLLLAALGLTGALVAGLPDETLEGAASVIDGDSFRLNGREIRLKGIDAPEYRQTCQGARGEESCGRDARQALARLLSRGRVACSLRGRDRYGRDLAYCRVGDIDLNATLVRDGQAVAFGEYGADEREARERKRGIWALTFDRPSVWREKHPRVRGEH